MNSPGGVLMYDGDPTESEEKTASEYEMSQSHQQMNHLLSYTKQNFPKIATPAEVPRPRGLARQTSRGKAGHPTYTVPRTQAPVRKTFWSRATYTWLLLNIIVWLPLWLKLITIRRKAASTEWVTIYDTDVTVELNVSSFQDRSTECFVCDKSNAGTSGIAYPIMARVEDFRASEKISTASYVVLFASFDWESWYVVNKAGLLMGLSEGTQDVDMCVDHAVEDDDAIVKQDDDDDDDFEVVQTVTTKEIVDDWEGDDDQTVLKKELITEVETERVNETLLIIPDDPERARQSYCCLGNPGFVYIVACVTPNADLRSGKSFYEPIEGPPFEDRCISLTSQCDYACDSVADQPVKDTCVNGEIPRDLLLSDKVYGDSSKNKDKRHYDRHFQQESPRAFFLHTTFIFFITMTAVGTWISFLPGTGISEEVAIPSIGEVEEHMEAHGEEQKPLCLCAFSISAQEPRMMVLRNICGKLIAWVNHRKFTFMSSVNSRDIVNSRKAENSTLFDDDEDGGGSGSSMTTSTWPNRPPISNADKRGGSADESQYLNDLVEIVDIFQDEGHRVGAYALWDAFVDTVNNGDLQFVVLLAEKMSEMSASDDLLKGKKPDDPDVHLLLDDELRAFAAKPETGVVQENVDRLELSFACYDLLTALGHHFFWRADMKLDIVGFRTLASNPEAVRVLRLWATNHREAVKTGVTSPFAAGVAPMGAPGIDKKVWNTWWELYADLGKTEWQKRFDVTKFRIARLHYFKHTEDAGEAESGRRDVYRDLIMVYSARANPEDLNKNVGIETRNVRGVQLHVFVRLKDMFSNRSHPIKHHVWGRIMQRSEARRCHGRVAGFCWKNGKRYVRLRECTPELLEALPPEMLTWGGKTPSELDYDTATLLNSHGVCGDEATVPEEILEPLRESRGKSGGMNHAMEILTNYLRHHSTTFELIRKKRGGVLPFPQSDEVDAHLLFAIFDCRHMATEGFWDAIVPYFYRYKHPDNPWARELEIDRKVAFVQLPQTFTGLSLKDDIFDMRNEYLFRMANTIRNGVGAITSCGTNAIWNYDIRYQENPVEHRFNEDTMIEDTASSHDVIIAGRKGVYHFERLVLGARKGTSDYLAAVFRWSKGAVQLFWTTFYYPRYRYKWPWIALCVHVLPIVSIVVYLQTATLNQCHHTPMTAWVGLVPCHMGPVVGFLADPFFVLYAAYMTTVACASFYWPRIAAHLIMFENITYFYSATSAFYWLAVPIFMCVAKQGIPTIFDPQLITAGGLWIQLHMAAILWHIKKSQQMFFITAPLHVLAICYGMFDGFNIVLRNKDASRWDSFDAVMAITAAKTWAVVMCTALVASIMVGLFRFIDEDSQSERVERGLGIGMCCILLFLVESPARAMFFYKRVHAALQRPSRLDRCTAALFGSEQVIRPDFLYMLLWILLLIGSLQKSQLAASYGVLNTATRCDIDDTYPGCEDDD